MSEARIRRLCSALVDKIAAGEVVERPASVIKELVENALDAGATEISVVIERGDDLRLSVVDNGTGMGRDDALLCFERHATSKISEASDLEALGTLGFRGEALAAIAAVAEVELITATRPGEATRVLVRGGARVKEQRAARERGTTVRVSKLFFNTPARRKFLKTQATEVRAASRAVMAHALATPGVGFTLTLNGETLYRFEAGHPLAGRMDGLFGRGLREQLIRVEGDNGEARVSGMVSPPRETRGVADSIFFAVNGRPIESRALQRALVSGYETLLGSRRYPIASLALSVPPDQVDPNVHPTKREVRFSNKQDLFRLVRGAVGRALRGEGIVPELSPTRDGLAGVDVQRVRETDADGFAPPLLRPIAPSSGAAPSEGESSSPAAKGRATAQAPDAVASGRGILDELLGAPEVLQVHRTYLIAESREGMLMVDQHTAHERILFEEGLARLAHAGGSRQPLLVPITVELSPPNARRLEEFAEPLSRLGFDLRAVGPNAYVVEAVPAQRRGEDIAGWLTEILDNLANDASPRDRLVRAATSFACKTAVRAGDTLRPEEVRSLLSRLARADNPFACPHGRPVVARVSLRDIERLFGRR